MNAKHISLAFAAITIASLLAGCAKSPIEEVKPSEQLTDLELSYVGATETKAAIDGTTFPQEGEIGLFLFGDEEATKAYGTGYENIKYSYNSTKGKWTASPSIKVGSETGYLYGYYPYSATATNVKAITVKSSLNGDDVMYATPVKDVTDANASQTAITMNHALARVAITVINKGYTGYAKLTKIKFAGAEIAPTGTLNALDGSLTATKSDVTLDVTGDAQTITAAGTTYECLLVPSAEDSDKQAVTLTLTIDGEEKTATLAGDNGVIIAQNAKSNITITLSNKGISVQTVSVDDWKVVEVGGHKVTIKVSDEVVAGDIMYGACVDGDDIVIHAYSYTGQHLKCNMPDGEFCTSQSKTGMVYTFTISDVTNNATATIGYASLVSLSVSPESSGSVEIIGDAYEGETVTLKALPGYEYGFDAWLDEEGKTLTCEDDVYSSPIRLSSGVMSAKFKKNLILDGVFSVSDGKKVHFTRGNLYFDGSSKVEQHQYDFNSANYTKPSAHVSHFMWCDNIANATSQIYNSSWDGSTTFFTEDGFTVNGFSKNQCRTLTIAEWQYLFSFFYYDNDVRRGKYKCGITVCGKSNCVVLLPDNWTGDTIESSYDYAGWKHLEAAGAVCLPAAGYRDGARGFANINDADSFGFYWSASTQSGNNAFKLYCNSDDVYPFNTDQRGCGYCVRLVTEYQSEPSAE